MTANTTNNKISSLISSQLPGFVRDDNPLFTSFMEAYYEYLEQNVLDSGSTGQGRVIERINALKGYYNIEQTLDDFANLLFNQFMQFIPQPDGSRVDFKKLLPGIKDFYRARGTEKSYKFLLRLLSNGSDTDILYPKDHIFKASDGKWFVQKSLRVTGTTLNGNGDSSLTTFQKYENRQIQGLSSNTTATVERVEQFYELGTLINEIFLTSISNTFTSGETVRAQYYDSSNNLVTLASNIFSGLVTSVVVSAAGSGYAIGNPVTFSGGGGTGAVAAVSAVSTGNVSSMSVVQGGSGYQAGNFLLFSGGGGTGANGDVLTVNTSGAFHPNTYNIDANQISQIANANWAAAQTIFAISTSNLALNIISSLTSTFVYANTGPVTAVEVLAAGSGYTSVPSISVISNTTIAALGILGSLIINNGGTGYNVGEQLTFTNPPGGFGFGAKANILSTNGTGSITKVGYYADPGEIPGGLGYFAGYLPTVGFTTNTGVTGNVTVASPLASGASITPTTGTIGSVLGVTVTSGGAGYTSAPTATLTGYGDGTANLTASIVRGVFTYPGYFLNQDGFPSSYNYIQDRDYWQNFSYVVRVGLAYEKWIQAVNNLLHPLGTRIWGEYAILDSENAITSNTSNPAYDSVYKQNQYFLANSTYFDGGSYMKDMASGYWFGTESGSMFLSQWFKFDDYLPNTSSEMTIFEGTLSNGAFARIKTAVKKADYVIGQNHVPFSEQMNNSPTWVTTQASWSVNAASVVTANGPSSSTTVVLAKLIPNAVNAQHYVRRYFPYGEAIPTGNNLTFSVFAQANEYYRFYLRLLDNPLTGSGHVVYFNVHPNAVATQNSMVLQSPQVIAANQATGNVMYLANGIIRCSISARIYANTKEVICDVITLDNTGSEIWTGEGTTAGIKFGGAQIEPGYIWPGQTLPNATYYSKTVTTAPTSILGNANDDPSGTGHYVYLRFANTNNFGTLAIKTDHIAHPLQANVWYHMIWGGNVAHPQTGNLFLNNVRSHSVMSRSANVTDKINMIEANVITFGANSAGGNTFKGYLAHHWSAWFAGIYDPAFLSVRDDWTAPPNYLTPNSALDGPTSNGFAWQFNSVPAIYMRSNTTNGNTNSGNGSKNFRVTGNTIGNLPGPGSPLTY